MAAMSTSTLLAMEALLHDLGVEALPPAPETNHQTRPIDIYGTYLADILSKATGCAPSLLYDSLQCPTTLEHSDLVLPVPRLRLNGKPPPQQSTDLATKFSDNHPLFNRPTPTGMCHSLYRVWKAFAGQGCPFAQCDRIHLPFLFAPRSLSRASILDSLQDGYHGGGAGPARRGAP
jgi:hypothetical protein